MPPGRPKGKPGKKSILNVLNAIRFCSCGTREGHYLGEKKSSFNRDLIVKKTRCSCVGPKSYTQLVELTGLGRNTVSNTCKYLVDGQILLRSRLRKPGNHVAYSITEAYRKSLLWRSEIESSAEELDKLLLFLSGGTWRKQGRILQHCQKMNYKYRDPISLLDAELPEASKELPIPLYYYLVKLIYFHGPIGGLLRYQKIRREKERKGPEAFQAFCFDNVFPKWKASRPGKSSKPIYLSELRKSFHREVIQEKGRLLA